MNHQGAVLALVLSACAIDSADPVDVDEPEIEPIARGCGPFGCMQNTAIGPDGEVFDELDWTRTNANASGIRIVSFSVMTSTGFVSASIHVEHDRLVAVGPTGTSYEGAALNGALMVLSKNNTPAFEALFTVNPADPVAFWGGDTTQTVLVYDIRVRRLKEGGVGKSACRLDPPTPNDWPGTNKYAALIFEGDRYKHDTHSVSDSVGSTWFNIACAGGYPAKLHLLRHTWAGGFSSTGSLAWPTSVLDRKTYLRAITADYFGTGETYTHTGVSLGYGDVAGISKWPSGTREALWKDGRAVCLDTPRAMSRASVVALGGWIETCTGAENAYVITAHPGAAPTWP